MVKEIEAEKSKKPAIFEDSIIAGILLAKGHTVTPFNTLNNRIGYHVEGDVEKSLQEIYANCPIGSLDVMRSVKLTRSMIFNLKGKR
jgi:hypothetical protein